MKTKVNDAIEQKAVKMAAQRVNNGQKGSLIVK
jgi:hypothetical protein